MRTLALALMLVVAMAFSAVAEASASAVAPPGDAPVAAKAKKKCTKGSKKARKKCKARLRAKARAKAKKKAQQKTPVTPVTPAPAPGPTAPSVYNGQATNLAGDFQYGAVTINRTAAAVTFVEIKSVTSSCRSPVGARTIVYNATNPDHVIIEGSNAINGGTMSLKFKPVPGVEDSIITLSITFSGSSATGTFAEQGPCTNEGKFTATG